MFQAILFDLGDTLLDFEPIEFRKVVDRGSKAAYARMQQAGCAKLPSYGRYVRSHEWVAKIALAWSRVRGRDFNILSLMKRLERGYGMPDDPQAMFDIAWQWYKPIVELSSIESDLLSTLQMFRNAGIKMGIVSNTYLDGKLLDHHLKLMGLLEYLPIRIYSSETRYRKPHRRIFEIALAAMGTAAAETLFVGDVVRNDVFGAGRMGMKTVLKAPLSVSRTHRRADYLIRRISELIPIVLPASATAANRA